ncbi:hypothetical protein FSP39_000772, partial [Pinctada imbricata]
TYTHWLMKSEPESRFENGIDVKFGIEDLKDCEDQTACWDGVRNYQARNFMRDQMKIGQKAYFYHSNCKEPGIAGICKIVKESYPDHTQFDKKDPHYDSKAKKDNPTWYMVDVKFVRMMKRFIPLSELKKLHLEHKQHGGPLKDVALFTRARLSVQPLTEVICCLVHGLDENVVHINLRNGLVRGYSPYISFIQPPKDIPGKGCNKQVVLKIDFSGKYRGAKFLLVYGEPPKFWTLDVSDSPAGDGYGGDNGTTSNMAEIQIHNKQLKIYGNDLPGHMDASSNGGLLIKTIDGFVKRGSKAKIDISDERVEWRSRTHKDYLESKFLFTLAGQKPTYGIRDDYVYVGLNRVVAGTFRNGSGLCEVEISLYTYEETEGIQNQDKTGTKANKQKPPPYEKKRTPDVGMRRGAQEE